MSDLRIEQTPIRGLLVVHLAIHEDARGWFKENWQREKMTALGLPDFEPVQHNVSYNASRGATRGIHAEPWDKYVSVTGGRAFGAWVDLREGADVGTSFHLELDPSVAVFVPRGVGNSYQTLDDGVTYSYLVNEHWRPGVPYVALALDDPDAAIPWPIAINEATASDKDRTSPRLADVDPMPSRRTLVLGSMGQLGRALSAAFPDADGLDRPGSGAQHELDLTKPGALEAWPWHEYDVLLNAAAYTAVDEAETPEGRRAAWATNATIPAALARIADRHRLTLVHFSSEYVFDGTATEHTEGEPLSPLGVYAQSKAAGDLAVSTVSRHYVLRTSWLIGEGRNFVRTMLQLAADSSSPTVVSDQVGRLTFADDLARATSHLLASRAAYGTYNVSSSGPAMAWSDVARRVFALAGRDPGDVAEVTTEQYAAGRRLAPRPRHSAFDLAKLRSTGFDPVDGLEALDRYCAADHRR